ncbi:hypothetical protein [Stackebrandtia soli]|uniref:hypothetical protein n=1 Tax=Stackebrandtia soli TaxID=1892856 RepID=UPI0039E91239
MAEEVLASPTALGQLSQDLVDISGDLRDELASTRDTGLIESTAFGNTEGVGVITAAYGKVYEAMGQAVEDLADVLEGDVDRVLRLAFAYQEQDERNADDMPDCVPGQPC